MKRLFVKGIGAVTALLLTACSDDAGTTATPATGDASTEVTSHAPADAATSADGSTSTDGGAPDAAPPPSRGVQDRAGRPMISQLLTSDANRDVYNSSPVAFAADPAAVGEQAQSTVGADFQRRLVTLDLLDGEDDWGGGAADAGVDPDSGVYPHPLANAWLTDVLVVDPDKPFSPTGYLDVELHPGENLTCGGRWFSDDAIDRTLSYLIKAKATGVSDGIGAATKAPSLVFPYLAPPN